MKLFKISQEQDNSYDTFDSAVVCCDNEETARNMNPYNGKQFTETEWRNLTSGWCNSPEHVIVEYIGEAREGMPQGLVCASFNAG